MHSPSRAIAVLYPRLTNGFSRELIACCGSAGAGSDSDDDSDSDDGGKEADDHSGDGKLANPPADSTTGETPPLPCVTTAFVATTLPLLCVFTASVATTLPVPCASAAILPKTDASVCGAAGGGSIGEDDMETFMREIDPATLRAARGATTAAFLLSFDCVSAALFAAFRHAAAATGSLYWPSVCLRCAQKLLHRACLSPAIVHHRSCYRSRRRRAGACGRLGTTG